MKYVNMKMNEIDLVENFSKEQLIEILEIQIEHENYEGAKVVKNAIELYDEFFDLETYFEPDEDEDNDKPL